MNEYLLIVFVIMYTATEFFLSITIKISHVDNIVKIIYIVIYMSFFALRHTHTYT